MWLGLSSSLTINRGWKTQLQLLLAVPVCEKMNEKHGAVEKKRANEMQKTTKLLIGERFYYKGGTN